jgi:hypothetical protein
MGTTYSGMKLEAAQRRFSIICKLEVLNLAKATQQKPLPGNFGRTFEYRFTGKILLRNLGDRTKSQFALSCSYEEIEILLKLLIHNASR